MKIIQKYFKILFSSIIVCATVVSLQNAPNVFASDTTYQEVSLESTTTLTVKPDETSPPVPPPIDPEPEPGPGPAPKPPVKPGIPGKDNISSGNGGSKYTGLIPQTGARSSQMMSLVGIMLVAISSGSLLLLSRRKEK